MRARTPRQRGIAMYTPSVDILLRNEATTLLFTPITQRADEWLHEHVDSEATWWCRALVVEPRYIADIVHGAQLDGLEVR
jgi:hypothetical protein